jgi:hypothetical protein
VARLVLPAAFQPESTRRPIGGKIVSIGKAATLEEYAVLLEWFDRLGSSADIPANAKVLEIRPATLEEWANRQN